jgi:uncharacterized protein YbjT (DUF2867 family)
MTSSTTVLVAGATGRLGSLIVKELLKKNVTVKILVRDEVKASELIQQGAIPAVGDIAKLSVEELKNILQGVDIVIATLTGGPDVLVDAQLKLLEAAKQAGVKLFVPADFGLDYLSLQEGDLALGLLKKQFDQQLVNSGVNYLIVVNGAFYDFASMVVFLDRSKNEFNYYGDLEARFDLTDIEDVARYTAAAVFKPELKNTLVRVRGDSLSLAEYVKANEQVSQQKLKVTRLGSADELRDTIADAKNDPNPYAVFFKEFQLLLINGKIRSDKIDNDLFPEIKPLPFKDYLARQASA